MNPSVRQDAFLYLPALRRMLLAVAGLVLLCHLALSLYGWALAGQFLVPSLERKAQNVGLAVARNLTRALAAGVPWNRMEGIQPYFEQVLRENPDLAYIMLTDSEGKMLVRAGHGGEVVAPEQYVSSTRSVERRYVTYAQVHVGVDRRFISARIAPIRPSAALLAVAGTLLAFLMAHFAASFRYVAPLRQLGALLTRMASGDYRYRAAGPAPGIAAAGANRVQARLNHAFFELGRQAAEQRRWAGAQDVIKRLRSMFRFADGGFARDLYQDRSMVSRMLAFGFLFAEALARPVLPAYAAAVPALAGAGALAQALPLSALFAGFALALPMARDWTGDAGRRATYAAGALLAALAMGAMAWVPDYAVLVVARATAGAGYALMYCACAPVATDMADRRGRHGALALFGSALLFAETCGPAIGGVLADVVGVRSVFLLGALLLPGAALLAVAMLDDAGQPPPHRNVIMLPSPALPAAVSRGARPVLALALAAGASQRFVFGALFAFLVPAWLGRMQYGGAEIARFYLLFGLASLLCAPLFLRMAFRSSAYAWLTVLGVALAVSGALPLTAGAARHIHQLFGLALLGFGALLCAGAQLLAAARAVRAARLRLGHFDAPLPHVAMEGAALVAGPLAVASAWTLWGARGAVMLVAVAVCVAAAAFGAVMYLATPRRTA